MMPQKESAQSTDAPLIEALRTFREPINVSQVHKLSPFRYPGGKTWLVPYVKTWLQTANVPCRNFVEPFAGGAIVGLSIAADGLADKTHLCELDEDVAAVWQLIFQGTAKDVNSLCRRILEFDVSEKTVRDILDSHPIATRNKAFKTIIKNRMQRGGILAKGAGLSKFGENGKGLHSRWYPETLVDRINFLRGIRQRIDFTHGDAFDFIKKFSRQSHAFYFVDPPYTAGGKHAGSRLYTHNDIDHDALFAQMAKVSGQVMMTYDDAPEVRQLAKSHGFRVEAVPMKNTHHAVMHELLILKP